MMLKHAHSKWLMLRVKAHVCDGGFYLWFLVILTLTLHASYELLAPFLWPEISRPRDVK